MVLVKVQSKEREKMVGDVRCVCFNVILTCFCVVSHLCKRLSTSTSHVFALNFHIYLVIDRLIYWMEATTGSLATGVSTLAFRVVGRDGVRSQPRAEPNKRERAECVYISCRVTITACVPYIYAVSIVTPRILVEKTAVEEDVLF